MNNLDFLEIERRARMMQAVEMRRLFNVVGHAVAERARRFARSLHPNTKSHA